MVSENNERAVSLPLGILGVWGAGLRWREGVPGAKQLHSCCFAPVGSTPRPFLCVELAHGYPSLVEPTGKSAQAAAAQPDCTRSGQFPRGPARIPGGRAGSGRRRLVDVAKDCQERSESGGRNTHAKARGPPPRQGRHQGLAEAQGRILPGPTPGSEPRGPGNLTIPVTL